MPTHVVDIHANCTMCPRECRREGGEVGTNYRGPGPCVVYVFVSLGSGVPRNFVRGGGSTNSVEDRENGDLGVVAP